MPTDRRVICISTHWPDFRLQAGVIDYAQHHRWQVLNLDHLGTRNFPLHHVDGLIANLGQEGLRERLERWGCPVVNLGTITPDWLLRHRHVQVFHDNPAIGRLAAEHFIHLGFRQVGYHRPTPYPSDWLHSNQRYEGFRRTAEAAGLRIHDVWGRVHEDRQQMVDRLRELPKPIALLCENDFMAMALCDLCREFHLVVPDEIAICGIENDPMLCPNNIPPLSSVDVNREEQGYRAAEIMDRLIDGEAPSEPVMIPPHGVVARRSTDHIAIDNPHVATALACIRKRAHEGIGAEDVVAAVGVSRATLYREFQRHFGHSIAAEIAHRRIQRACSLLAGSDQDLAIVARSCGFSSSQHLRRSFLRDKGLTPTDFRNRARSHAAVIQRDDEWQVAED